MGRNENITNFANVWMLEDPIQQPKVVTYGLIQLYFYKNLFFQGKNSKVNCYKKLINVALETLLDELFILDHENNERIINQYIQQRRINMT